GNNFQSARRLLRARLEENKIIVLPQFPLSFVSSPSSAAPGWISTIDRSGRSSNPLRPRDRGKSKEALRKTISAGVSSSCEWIQRLVKTFSGSSAIFSGAYGTARSHQGRLHARDLPGGEHHHRGVVHVVH